MPSVKFLTAFSLYLCNSLFSTPLKLFLKKFVEVFPTISANKKFAPNCANFYKFQEQLYAVLRLVFCYQCLFIRPISLRYCIPSNEMRFTLSKALALASSCVAPVAVTPSTLPPEVTIAAFISQSS